MSVKQRVGDQAASYVTDGMIVGLGTGSTAYFMIEALGKRVKEEGLSIIGVPTSKASEQQARQLGIPIKTIDEVPYVDLTIDGADEIGPNWIGIKGGGGALLFEKIVANYSKQVLWIVDSSKIVPHLGAFPLPVEVIPYGSEQLMHLFQLEGLSPKLRLKEDQTPFITDSGHFIIDLHLSHIKHPRPLAQWLTEQVGVVEHGLFIDVMSEVLVGTQEDVLYAKKSENHEKFLQSLTLF